MDHQQCFVVGVSGSGRPVEAARDDCFVVDHRELVVDDVECVSWIGSLGLLRSDKPYISHPCE